MDFAFGGIQRALVDGARPPNRSRTRMAAVAHEPRDQSDHRERGDRETTEGRGDEKHRSQTEPAHLPR